MGQKWSCRTEWVNIFSNVSNVSTETESLLWTILVHLTPISLQERIPFTQGCQVGLFDAKNNKFGLF